MNTFVLEVWDDESAKCTFYTVRWVDAEQNETDKFFNKYDALTEWKEATQQLLSFVLDLYALRINDRSDLVVLFNGGVKSSQTNHGSRDLILKWREACQFARRIEEALRNNEIIVDKKKRRLYSDLGDEEIFL